MPINTDSVVTTSKWRFTVGSIGTIISLVQLYQLLQSAGII